jgi:hypothetical protein
VTPGRLELPTNGLGNRCSIHLSYGATSHNIIGWLVYRNWTAGTLHTVANRNAAIPGSAGCGLNRLRKNAPKQRARRKKMYNPTRSTPRNRRSMRRKHRGSQQACLLGSNQVFSQPRLPSTTGFGLSTFRTKSDASGEIFFVISLRPTADRPRPTGYPPFSLNLQSLRRTSTLRPSVIRNGRRNPVHLLERKGTAGHQVCTAVPNVEYRLT